MAMQGSFTLEEFERQINLLPPHVLGRSTESVVRPLRAFLEAQKQQLRRQGPCDRGLQDCLLTIFPDQEALVNYFVDDYSGIAQTTLQIYIWRATKGDTRAKGVLYALMLSYLQGGSTEFEEVTGMQYYGPDGPQPQRGGNCANFASWFLYYGMGLALEDWDTPDEDELGLDDWELSRPKWVSPPYQGTPAWTTAETLYSHLKQRASWKGDITLTNWPGESTSKAFVMTTAGRQEDVDVERNRLLEYGDLVFYSDPAQHVAVVVGYGPQNGGTAFYPTYEEAVRAVYEDVPEGENAQNQNLTQMEEILQANGIRIVAWQVDHSGSSEVPRPVGSSLYGDPSYWVHIEYEF